MSKFKEIIEEVTKEKHDRVMAEVKDLKHNFKRKYLGETKISDRELEAIAAMFKEPKI